MLTIDTSDRIIIDGQATGLALTQRRDGTVIYTPEAFGRPYAEHQMPRPRYSSVHEKPASGAAGRTQLEADVRKLLALKQG